MDKQSLKKHHFWLLLALCVILIPIVLGGAVFSVGSAATEAKGKIDKKIKDLQAASPKSQAYLDNLDEQKKTLEEQRNKIWKEVYDAQAGLIRWPARLTNLESLYFGDKIIEDDRQLFREDAVYLEEYRQLPAIIAPTQFLDKDWGKVLRYIPEFKTLPSSEDAWLALENLCVQREVLRDIHNVNNLLARFLSIPTPIDASATPADRAAFEAEKTRVDKEVRDNLKVKDGEAFGRFLSPYWQLDIAVARSVAGKAGELVFRGKVTNVSGRRQNVARIDFKVWLTDPLKEPNAPPVVIPVQTDFLSAGDSFTFDDVKVTAAARSLKLFAVEQRLDLRFAPVKRVDRLELGYLSHRYAGQQLLQPNGPAFEEAKAPATGQGSDPTGLPPTGPPGGRDEGVPGRGAVAANVSRNGLERDRYLHRTDQVRRMPIAVVLVVDQSHLQDVERAFANSRLRFQNVQFHWQRFRGTMDLNETSTTPGGASMTTGTAPGAPTGREGPPRPRIEGGGGSLGTPSRESMVPGPGPGFVPGPLRPAPGPGGTDPNHPPGSTEDQTSSLIEVTVYGIASLYERFPPRPAPGTAPEGTQPAAVPPTSAADSPATPAAPTAPAPSGSQPTSPTGNQPPPPPPPPVPPAPAPSPIPPAGPPPG